MRQVQVGPDRSAGRGDDGRARAAVRKAPVPRDRDPRAGCGARRDPRGRRCLVEGTRHVVRIVPMDDCRRGPSSSDSCQWLAARWSGRDRWNGRPWAPSTGARGRRRSARQSLRVGGAPVTTRCPASARSRRQPRRPPAGARVSDRPRCSDVIPRPDPLPPRLAAGGAIGGRCEKALYGAHGACRAAGVVIFATQPINSASTVNYRRIIQLRWYVG